jgi:uncharacterized protein
MNENEALVRSLYDAFGRGDLNFILERVAADVDWRHSESPALPYHGVYRGVAEVRVFFERLAGSVQVERFEPRLYLASGDDVMAAGRWSGVATATGRRFGAPWAMHWVIKRGKVAGLQVYDDTAVVAAALRPAA